MPAEIEVVYRVGRPSGAPGSIEVYGEPDMDWYEWRIKERGTVIHDTGREGACGRQYGSAAIALRDALNHDEPPLDSGDAHRALCALAGLAQDLKEESTEVSKERAFTIQAALDAVEGYGTWPPSY